MNNRFHSLIESIRRYCQEMPPETSGQFQADVQHLANLLSELSRADAHLEALANNMPDDYWSIDSAYHLTQANPNFSRSFQEAHGQPIQPGDNLMEKLPEPARSIWKDRYDRALNREKIILIEDSDLECLGRYCEITLVPIFMNEEVIGVTCFSRDLTDRKQAEEELQQANEKLIIWVDELEKHSREAKMLRDMDDLLQVCDVTDDAYTVIAQHGAQLFPGTSGALYRFSPSRRTVEAVVVWGDNLQSERVFSPNECWALRRSQIHMVSQSKHGLRCRHIDPNFEGDYIGIPMMASGETMGMLHVQTNVKDSFTEETQELVRTVGERISLSLSNLHLRETLRAQSIRDPLTGLFNRRYMEESLEREFSRAARKQTPVGVIMLDIDHFKSFNDTYGHEAGDVILSELGELLRRHIRAEDIACRYGGEEFILILPDASVEVTRERADQIRKLASAMNVNYQNQPLGQITISVGVAAFPNKGRKAEDILRDADTALFHAKHNGRNRVEVSPSRRDQTQIL